MNICFVMMPFGEPFDDYYKEIYQPVIEENGLIPKRADSIYRPSPILHDIWTFINDSKLLIGDITGRNPNVMYELGLAHAISKPVIIITNNIDDVPFDLRSLRILVYNNYKPTWSLELKQSINSSIKEILQSPTDLILPTFLNIIPSKREEVSEVKKDLIEIKQFLYRLDLNEIESDKRDKIKILSAEDYGKAVNDAHHLYYQDGLAIPDIRNYLTAKYEIGIHTATDIVLLAQKQ